MPLMRMMSLLFAITLITGLVSSQDSPSTLVNLEHLLSLTEPVTIDGREMAIVHIYSEAPDYEWVDDADEGISAVDDVARAAVVYLWEYERTGDKTLLMWARRCLEFVRYMQADDGEFYNFVFTREGQINETGGTSYKSLGWWAMRGLWSLGEGVRVFQDIDPAYADELADAYLRTEAAIAITMSNYGQYNTVHNFKIPAWFPANEPDIASIGVLGMTAYYHARPNEITADIITKIANGLAEYRLGTDSEYPFGMHPNSANAPGLWHNWGAHMPHALVMAGIALDHQDWIESAAATANSFLLRQLAIEPFRHIGVIPYRQEQIAYGTNMLVQAYASLYQATGDEIYAQYAGLAGSWYFGNNMAETQMYDSTTGRTFDGINGPVSWRVNRNSGGESTIEGLMSMSVLAQIPIAQEYLAAKTVETHLPVILQAEDGDRVIGTPVYYSGDWTGEGYISAGRYIGLGEGQRMRLIFTLKPEQEDNYLLYVAHMRQAANSSAFLIPRTETPPVIDGNSDDWPEDAVVLDSNTARQLLRGGGLWKGANVDSHSVRLTWDNTSLYVLATVRDPEHVQEATVSNVWQGDTLWLYFTKTPDARTISAKLTLTQTPQGPQVWSWNKSEFAEGAAMVWTQGDDSAGYIYEAAIPWSLIGVEAPQAGTRIGFEAGRGIGGNSFMDLTGRDPDVAANLMQLTLTAPGFDTSSSDAPDIALKLRLNQEDAVILPESTSDDSDYFWLDLVTPQPIHLSAGENTLRYEYAGGENSSNPGLSKIDAFYLQPATARRVFALENGEHITLTYNTLTGESALSPTQP